MHPTILLKPMKTFSGLWLGLSQNSPHLWSVRAHKGAWPTERVGDSIESGVETRGLQPDQWLCKEHLQEEMYGQRGKERALLRHIAASVMRFVISSFSFLKKKISFYFLHIFSWILFSSGLYRGREHMQRGGEWMGSRSIMWKTHRIHFILDL